MIVKNIDTLFHRYNSPTSPGACIMIIKNWKVVFEKAYGMAHVSKKIPNTTKTNFRLASVTKQFTATCIMKLVEQKKITYDDTIIKFFPQLPQVVKNVTIQHLLTHTSWLPDDDELIPKNRKLQVHDKNYLVYMQKIKKVHFSPGEKFEYINVWYCLLSLIVEKVSWMTFDLFLKKYIFGPLKMHHTLLYTHWGKNILDRAYGYEHIWSSYIPRDQRMTSATSWDGWIYSSIEDLYKRDQALYTDKIVSFSSLKRMFSPTQLHNGKSVFYGFGEEIHHSDGTKILYHWWSSCGFKNFIYRIPSRKLSVIFLSNRNTWWEIAFAKKILDASWIK